MIRAKYQGVDVDTLLDHFTADRPTVKDTVVLLAMSIRFVRRIDEVRPSVTGSSEVRRWLAAEGLLAEVEKLEKQSANGGSADPRARGRQLLRTALSALADPYHEHGAITDA